MAINPDFAPTFMDMAGLPVPPTCRPQPGAAAQGPAPGGLADELLTTATTTTPAITILAPITACATTTHKLICFWKKDQWECSTW